MIHIIGGGIIGLSIGWRLCQTGAAVTVYERGPAGREASWAAAGMIAPSAGPDPHYDLMDASHKLWPDFAAELEEMSSLDLGYSTFGNLTLAIDEPSLDYAKLRHSWFQNRGWNPQWLTGAEARQLEPNLPDSLIAASFNEHWDLVNNRQATKALAIAFKRAGGILRENVNVSALEHDDKRVTGIVVNGSVIGAETVVLAAGAWSGLMAALPAHVQPQIIPYKGQLLSLAMPKDNPTCRLMLSRPIGSIVPHLDGSLIIGGTKEKGVANKQVKAGVIADLLADAARYLPATRELAFIESWAGVRPGTVDGRAYLGPTELKGFHLATGHFMDGILLAPVTAQLVSEAILTGHTPDTLKSFSVHRHTTNRTA